MLSPSMTTSKTIDEVAQGRVGQVVADRYELQRLLGVGASGAVYEAIHRYTDRSVALKAMHPHLTAAPEAVRRFLREARAAAAVGHPGIPQVLDAGTLEDGRPYIVNELLEGRSLDEAIRAKDLTLDDVTTIGVQLCDVLAAAHDVHIVHRDVKPENVFLVREKGTLGVRLLDFGVAKNLQSVDRSGILTKPGTAIGTPTYMAPEQARALPVDARTDLWGAGATLFHAATGRTHFQEPSLPMLLMRIVTSRPPRIREVRADVPDALARAIDGALEPDVAHRWPDARAMAAVLAG
ncbi:Serine/threonine protein kinase [Sandaracinus amylolyticus]|uniref:Serine/threonine protein kinase n=2 Tax=Sandaracinus amylolyticus TaxID=927083 RepID=A0A0F6WAN4_9BACT|nr:Serine/threonine protein kinase [Sandaracinus amylolyticus]